MAVELPLHIRHPPTLRIESEVAADRFYQILERTWVLQQVPVALALFWLGGWSWVVWGVFGRVFVGVAGHWTVTFWTHNPGPGTWTVPGAGVQASNLVGAGFITRGDNEQEDLARATPERAC